MRAPASSKDERDIDQDDFDDRDPPDGRRMRRDGRHGSARGILPMKNEIIRLRHELHRLPELSGRERATALRLLEHFALLDPDDTVSGLGGHGLAFVFAGAAKGPTVLLRADLDALPITEAEGNPHRSENEGVAHLCGHDGHMTILAEVGRRIATKRPARGRVVLLFQPAEETGEGAAAVLADPAFAAVRHEPEFLAAVREIAGRWLAPHRRTTIVAEPEGTG